jgi:glycosyltransferase involved in cell wall biosynthesis
MQAHLYGALAARCAGIPVVVLSKHGQFFPMGIVSGRLNRRLMRKTRIVAVSEDIRREMTTWMTPGCPPVCCIPNGISLAAYQDMPSRSAARSQLGWPVEEYLIGIVARLSDGKNHTGLLHAHKTLLGRFPRSRLIIVGEGAMRFRIEEAIAELGLSSRVELLGERHDIPQILGALDVFCLPSSTEGMPMTILEAMAARLPVVATRVGGVPDIVRNDETGLLVGAGDSGALAAALIALAGDAALRRKMGEAGRKLLEDRYSLRAALQAYEQLYGG